MAKKTKSKQSQLRRQLREAAAAVLLAPCEEFADKRSVLVATLCTLGERALQGDVAAAELLLRCAQGRATV